MTASDTDFRTALRRWASGVSVVTTATQGVCHGMTVSAFTSVSLKPPLICVCLANTARTLEVLRLSGHFAVNILEQAQRDLSQRFGQPTADGNRFDSVRSEAGILGSPLLSGALVHLECSVHALHVAGDHTLCVGAVQRATTHSGEPLLYYAGAYGEIAARA